MINSMPGASKLRLAFLGDSITVGDGDTQARGWPSRLCQTSSPMPTKTQCYNLGVGGDHIVDLSNRVSAELSARLTGKEGRGVVIMIGINNALRAAAQINNTPFNPDSITADLLNILKEARRYGAVLVVEPAPVLPEFEHRDGISGTAVMQHLTQVNKLQSSACESAGVPLLSLTSKLMSDPEYIAALRDGDGLHPHDVGFDRIASHVSMAAEWNEFLQRAKQDV